MPANVYECMFLLDTNKVAGDVPSAAKQLHGILEKNHAEILASRPWNEQRLAYPIKNHKKGLYYLVYFRTEGNNLVAFAMTTGQVLMKSDGTPWRPIVHIEDISRAFLAALALQGKIGLLFAHAEVSLQNSFRAFHDLAGLQLFGEVRIRFFQPG